MNQMVHPFFCIKLMINLNLIFTINKRFSENDYDLQSNNCQIIWYLINFSCSFANAVRKIK
ncbi:hypothetical protein B0I22_0669 [Epilithonimonas xixisoli]|uniref:Uncharacterized protein n=1 Tax=Epilithonimonas xixisoli TaxID=1476462 RepID=A0A4R8I969_9FLAO|nr:hypothetical protein B0I22_0669 [Epilithonimonas xixisoli]